MITTPVMPSNACALSIPRSRSAAELIRLPTAVAAASARAAEKATTHTASARPKLRDGPTVPEEVQTPQA